MSALNGTRTAVIISVPIVTHLTEVKSCGEVGSAKTESRPHRVTAINAGWLILVSLTFTN